MVDRSSVSATTVSSQFLLNLYIYYFFLRFFFFTHSGTLPCMLETIA
jgi:hypothetical protein